MSWQSSERGGEERDDMSGRRVATALRWSALLLPLAAAGCSGTSDFMSGAHTALPGTEGHIVVDVRWDLGPSGPPQHHAIWLSPQDETSAAWQRLDLDDDPDDRGAAWLALCNAYRDRCYALSEQAYDALRTDSHGTLPSDEDVVTHGRTDHLVLPSADLSRAVILHAVDGWRGIIELPSLHELPWPAGIDWGDAGGARAAPGPVAGWCADGSRLALVVGDGGPPKRDGTPQAPARVLVFNGSTGALVHHHKIKGYVAELAWSPAGTQLAVLAFDARLGDGSTGQVGAASGQGRPYSKVFIQVIDLATGAVRETPLGDWLPEVTAHVVWDPQAVTTRANGEMP